MFVMVTAKWGHVSRTPALRAIAAHIQTHCDEDFDADVQTSQVAYFQAAPKIYPVRLPVHRTVYGRLTRVDGRT